MKYILLILMFLTISITAKAEELADGTYDATVTTPSGTYTVPVEVEDGEVTHVNWPNGGNMSVSGGELEDGEASGYNSRGDSVDIDIEE